jgi:hypothetical protein
LREISSDRKRKPIKGGKESKEETILSKGKKKSPAHHLRELCGITHVLM